MTSLSMRSPRDDTGSADVMILAARWRREEPTAIGRTPPSFFSRATKVAPKKKGRTDVGVLPSTMRFKSDVRALSRVRPPVSAENPVISLRCWGLNPSGPDADPFGKEHMACKTSSSVTEVEGIGSWGGGGMLESGCGVGCLC